MTMQRVMMASKRTPPPPPSSRRDTDDDLQVLLAGFLRRKRRVEHVGQKELAKRMGVHQSLVTRIESGARRPGLIDVVRYLHALDLNYKTAIEEFVAEADLLD